MDSSEDQYEGLVNGIDVQVSVVDIRCQAFINKSESEYIQVQTSDGRVQSALEAAAIKMARVEVFFAENEEGSKIITRIRILDR